MSDRLQACHRALSLTRQMLELARHEHWDALDPLQQSREDQLRILEDDALPRSAEEAACLTEMLQCQAELMQCVARRQDELSHLLSTHEAGRRMSQAYGQVSGRKELL